MSLFGKKSKKTYDDYDDWDDNASIPSISKWDKFKGKFSSLYDGSKDKTKEFIIDPDLDSWTKGDVNRALDRHIGRLNDKQITEIYQENLVENPIIHDIFKSYFYHPEETTRINTDNEHSWKATLLDKVSNHYLKTITRGNELYSSIVTNYLTTALYNLLVKKRQQMEQKQPGSSKGMGLKELLDGLSDSDIEAAMEQSANQAAAKIGEIESKLNDMCTSKEAGKMLSDIETLDKLEDIETYSNLIGGNAAQLSKFVKGCYKRMVSYYNANATMYEEPFLDAENIEGLDEIEQLLPVFKHANIEDLVVQNFTFSFKFDIYIDASGSMSDRVHMGNGKSISRYDLCRYLTVKLHKAGVVKDIYLFDTRVQKVRDIFHLMNIAWGGGTAFDAVIRNIKETKMSSVILTDMCDHIGEYTKGAYFIGMQTFHPQATPDIIRAYQSNKQFVVFDGTNFNRPNI